MFLMDYPMKLVVSAMISMYCAYMAIDALYMLVAYGLADRDSRRRLRSAWWVFIILPAFRYITFWFRFGGFLEVLMEPPQWRVRNPWVQTMDGLLQLRVGTIAVFTQMSHSRLISVLVNLIKSS